MEIINHTVPNTCRYGDLNVGDIFTPYHYQDFCFLVRESLYMKGRDGYVNLQDGVTTPEEAFEDDECYALEDFKVYKVSIELHVLRIGGVSNNEG